MISFAFKSSSLHDAYMRYEATPSLILMMASRPLNTKPFSETMLAYFN